MPMWKSVCRASCSTTRQSSDCRGSSKLINQPKPASPLPDAFIAAAGGAARDNRLWCKIDARFRTVHGGRRRRWLEADFWNARHRRRRFGGGGWRNLDKVKHAAHEGKSKNVELKLILIWIYLRRCRRDCTSDDRRHPARVRITIKSLSSRSFSRWREKSSTTMSRCPLSPRQRRDRHALRLTQSTRRRMIRTRSEPLRRSSNFASHPFRTSRFSSQSFKKRRRTRKSTSSRKSSRFILTAP